MQQINLMKENEMKSCGEDEYNEDVKPKNKSTIKKLLELQKVYRI